MTEQRIEQQTDNQVKAMKEKKTHHSLLLFKNAVKQAFRNKVQLIGLAVLVLLSSTIFSLMQTSLSRVANRYEDLISAEQSNIHDFVFDPYNTTKLSSAPPIDHPEHPVDPAATVEDQQLYLNEIANNTNNSFVWDRIEARTFQLNNKNDPKVLKLVTYNADARIDKLVLSEGFNIGANPNDLTPIKKQTVVNKEFAAKNHLKLGDIIRVQLDRLGDSLKVNYDINDPEYAEEFNWLKIVGFGTTADFITPIIDQTTPLPNKNREGILYVDPSTFGFASLLPTDENNLWFYDKPNELFAYTSDKDREIYYVGKSTMTRKNNLSEISDYFKERYINTTDSKSTLVYRLGDSKYRFNSRTATLPGTIQAFKSLLIALLLIVLTITGITVVLITFKNIDNSKPQIGILKSLGYSNWKILITSLAYPMFAALVGTILVFFPASGLQILVVNTFANYFNLNFGKFVFDGLSYLYCLLLTFGFLSIIAWIISALTVIKNPIALIKNISRTRDSQFTKFVKKTSANAKFLTRFRLALFTSSIGKMLAVFLTMFLGTILMTTAIIGPKVMSDNQRATYTGMNYKSLTEYANPTYNSPFSFYKTYNPNNEPWDYKRTEFSSDNVYVYPDRDDTKYSQDLLNNSINSEAYAPMTATIDQSAILNLGLNHLTYLYGKMFTKDFLTALDASTMNPSLIDLILSFAWPDVMPMYNDIVRQSDIYTLANYQAARTFYINYRSTIAMNLNPNIKKDNDEKEIDPAKLIDIVQSTNSWTANQAVLEPELNSFQFDRSDKNYPWHLMNEKELFNNPEPTDDAMQQHWISQMLIWFYSMFYNRVGQGVAQGTYSQSPYFIRQNIAKAFEDPNGKFNISFNVVPFDKETDELGTYFVGTPDKEFNGKQYPIKVYGLQKETDEQKSLMQLYNTHGHSLNSALERINPDGAINIVINQTIAKQLRLKENQTFKMAANGNILKTNQIDGHPNEYLPIDTNEINFTGLNNSGNPPGENNVTLLSHQTTFNQVPELSNSGAYQNMGTNATKMLQQVTQGNIVNERDSEEQTFRVVGVYNGYGQPTAYISKDNADHLLHFDDAKNALYKIFKQEWQTKPTVNNIEFNKLASLDTYQQFDEAIENNNPLKTVFNNEFPIFNFKFSSSEELVDITKSFSISQAYGDYSTIGMNGGRDANDGVSYPVYGEGTAVNVLPIYTHKQLLEQITQLVDTVLLFFIIFSLIISFFIILLTSNLVIYENRMIIATMKTLGYSNAKITNIVIGMYLPVIITTWIIGVPIGWVIVNLITNYLAYNTTWVLPLLFAWWLPVVIGLVVLGIYAITFIIEWQTMKKIKPLTVLNETN